MLPLLLLSRRRGATAALLAPLAAAARANPAPANHSPLAGGVAPPVAFYQAPFQAAAAFHAASGSRGDSFNPILPDARPPDCAAPLGAESPVPLHAKRMPHLDRRIGFMGSGQMAEALAKGLINKNVVDPGQICCTDPVAARKELFQSFGATAFDTTLEVAQNADVLFVAVKPQYVCAVLAEARPYLSDRHVIVSIAAGVTIEKLLSAAGPDAHVVRVMPNTPCLVGETAAAMCVGGKATPEDAELVSTLFSAVGRIYQLDEKLLAAVTGLSGSGPAFVFLAIEALADGGVRAGLPRDVAQALAAQTVLGSAKMVLDTGRHPGALKDMVTSPGGTTITGMHELEKAGVRAAFMSAVVAATNRANELSKM